MWLCGCNYACDGEYLVPLHPQTPIAPTHKCNGKPHQSPIFHEKIMKTAATNVKMMVSCFILHYIFFGAASFSATCILFISLLRSFISLPSVFYSNVLHLPVCLFVTFQYFALPRILPPAALSTTLSQSWFVSLVASPFEFIRLFPTESLHFSNSSSNESRRSLSRALDVQQSDCEHPERL